MYLVRKVGTGYLYPGRLLVQLDNWSRMENGRNHHPLHHRCKLCGLTRNAQGVICRHYPRHYYC